MEAIKKKRVSRKTTDTININVNVADVPAWAKDKVFPVKKGRVTSKYDGAIFIPGLNFRNEPEQQSGKVKVSKASSQADGDNVEFSEGVPPPVDPKTLLQLREYNAYHDRSIRIKAHAAVGNGFNILPVDDTLENYDKLPNYLKVKNFTDNPNLAGERFVDILKGYAEDYYTFFYCYMEVVSNAKGELKEVYNLRAPSVRVKPFNKKIYFIQKFKNKSQEFALFQNDRSKRDNKLNEVLWSRGYSAKSKYYCIPDYYSAVGDIMLDRSSVEYNINRFKNGLMIDFMIIVEGGDVDETVLTDVNNFLSKNYQGLANAGKALYLNSDTPDVKIRVEKISADIKDASFLKQREFSREVVMVSHNMNSKIWGLATAGQLGSGEGDMMFRLFEELIGRPDRLMFQDKLNQLIRYGLSVEDFYIELKELSVESWKDLVEAANAAANIIDRDEQRMIIGYEPQGEDGNISDQLAKMNSQIRLMKKKITQN